MTHRTMMKGCLPIASVFFLILTSCSSARSRQLAELSVDEFHSRMNLEEYHLIYSEADDAFRQAAGEAEFTALLQGVHRKLGRVRGSRSQSYQVGWFAGQGTRVTLVYQTEFANGVGSERFVWHMRDGRAFLVRYDVNSNALVTN